MKGMVLCSFSIVNDEIEVRSVELLKHSRDSMVWSIDYGLHKR